MKKLWDSEPCFREFQWTNKISSNQFLLILTQVKMLRISHCESTFTTLPGGPSGLVLYSDDDNGASSTTQTPSALTQLVHTCLSLTQLPTASGRG